MSRRAHALVLPLALIALGGSLLAEQGWIAVKGRIARVLIERAYRAHLDDGGLHRPWRWADTYPLGRLEVPRLGIRRTVLAGASGSSLAFGPGHVDGTAPPGAPGNCAIAGHRDSWFSFLAELREGDEIVLGSRNGRRRYRVAELAVRSMWETEVLEPTRQDRLTLITCHPFDGITRGTDRYVVRCVPLDSEPRMAARTLAAGGRSQIYGNCRASLRRNLRRNGWAPGSSSARSSTSSDRPSKTG